MRPVIRPPATLDERGRWREAVAAWRACAPLVAGYSGEAYADEAFAWSQACFSHYSRRSSRPHSPPVSIPFVPFAFTEA